MQLSDLFAQMAAKTTAQMGVPATDVTAQPVTDMRTAASAVPMAPPDNTFVKLAMMNGVQATPPGVQTMAPPAPGTPGGTTPTPAPPVNPFSGLVDTLPASGFQNDTAKQWLAQALGPQGGVLAPSSGGGGLPGWGGPQNPGQANAPGTTPNGPVLGQPYTFSGEVSPEAMKIKKAIKKMQNAKGWSVGDIGKIVGAAALTYATGGSTAGILASALGGAMGANKGNKAASLSLHKWHKAKNTMLPQIGWTQDPKGGWLDASGNHMSRQQVAQVLLNLGAFGGGG